MDKERTALSILTGLRQKFALGINKNETYSALELHKLFSELILKVNRGEEISVPQKVVQNEPIKSTIAKELSEGSKIWGEVENQIERSKIRRYNWNGILGHSLTKEILRLKKSGLDVEDTFTELLNNDRIIRFLDENEVEAENIVKNIKISVHARFGENNTAKKVEEENEKN